MANHTDLSALDANGRHASVRHHALIPTFHDYTAPIVVSGIGTMTRSMSKEHERCH